MDHTAATSHEFWRTRWQAGQIGFHEGKPNRFLVEHEHRLGPLGTVLVPLAGKTRDMAFLRDRGHAVTGVELVEAACRGFFTDDGATPSVAARGPFRAFRAHGVELLCGDVFDALPERVGRVDAVYDRAALIALAPEDRARYAALLARLVRPGGRILLVTLRYDQRKVAGPPYSVDDALVRRLFSRDFAVEPLDVRASPANPRMREAGVDTIEEAVAVLTRLGP